MRHRRLPPREALANTARSGEFRVDGVRSFGGYVVHCGDDRGELSVGDNVEVLVDTHRRAAIMANHTATHLLNFAARSAGRRRGPERIARRRDRLRFDFLHAKVSLPEELGRVEAGVKTWIDLRRWTSRSHRWARAKASRAAPCSARFIRPGLVRQQASRICSRIPAMLAGATRPSEFCGGTHVQNTPRDIHAFALVSEEAVAKGIRRITALTGVPAARGDPGRRRPRRIASARPQA